MNMKRLAGSVSAIVFAAMATSASAADLKLFHSWSNESEIRALNVFVDELKKRGHTVQELNVPHEQVGAGGPIVALVLAGTPPNIFLTGNADIYRDLRDRGLGQSVLAHFKESGAWDNFFPVVQEAIMVDGDDPKIPSGIHHAGVVYYNVKVAEAAGVDPKSWTSLEDMFADMKTVQDAGYNFMALGGNTFQAGYLTHALVAAVAGPDIYRRFYEGVPDKSVLDEPDLRRAFEVFRMIADQADEGWVNRSWNETTNTVISGQTLMHYHGDWMKGQWKANDKVIGEDYSCINLPGAKAITITVDASGILGGDSVDDETLAAELEWADIVTDPVLNAEFAFWKGATPVRKDASRERLDECNQLVLDSMAADNFSVPNPYYIADADWVNSIWNTMFTFQGDKDMSIDEVIETLKDEYDAIFS